MNLMEKLGAPGIDAEGQFLPETYRFPGGTTDVELLRQAHVALRARVGRGMGGSRSDAAAAQCR